MRPCVGCGELTKRKSYKTGRHLCGEPACGVKARQLAFAVVPCAECGAPVTSVAKTGSHRFCDKRCNDRWRSRRRSRRKAPRVWRECEECGAGTWRKRFCAERCTRKFKRRERNHLKRATASPVERGIGIRTLIRRDLGICGICKQPVACDQKAPHPLSPTIDHVTPLARGGTHTWANVQLAHFRCNSLKSDTLGEWEEGDRSSFPAPHRRPKTSVCAKCGATFDNPRTHTRKCCNRCHGWRRMGAA